MEADPRLLVQKELGIEAKRASLRRLEQLFVNIRLHKNYLDQEELPQSVDGFLAMQELEPLRKMIESHELLFSDLPEDIQNILEEWDFASHCADSQIPAPKEAEVVKGASPEQTPKSDTRRHIPAALSLEGFCSFLSRDELRPIREIIGRARAIIEDDVEESTMLTPSYFYPLISTMSRLGMVYEDLPAEFTHALNVLKIGNDFQDLLQQRILEYDPNSLGVKLQILNLTDRLRFLRLAHDVLLVNLTGIVYRSGMQLRIPPEDVTFFGLAMRQANITLDDLGLRLNLALQRQGISEFLR